MKKLLLLILLIILGGNKYIANCQTIRGQVVGRFLDEYDPLPVVSVIVNTTGVISDNDGLFLIDSLTNRPDSIMLEGYFQPTLKIINLPKDYDTLDLGSLEMISHKLITENQYDSLQRDLIKTFEKDLKTVQESKANKILKSKYRPIYDWAVLLGYVVLDEIESNKMINPIDVTEEVLIDYDQNNDMIILDYSKLKKTGANKLYMAGGCHLGLTSQTTVATTWLAQFCELCFVFQKQK